MRKIGVINLNEASEKQAKNWFRGTYAHGELESELGYDLFTFTEREDFDLGANKVIIKHSNREATFFLWKTTDEFYPYRGLLVYNDDSEYRFCESRFETKKEHI